MLLLNLLFFIISCAFLIVSGIFLVKSLSKIASFLKISEFSAAFIIMALATSIPELFVGISSALSKVPELSLGNIIGANILDLTLITGIIILLSKEIKTGGKKIGKDFYFMLGALALMIILYVIGNTLSRIDGLILVGFFSLSMYRRIKRARKYKTKMKNKIKRTTVVSSTFIFAMAFFILLLSSKYVVKYASNLALDLNFPKIIIGIFLLSIATTLPELVFGISASRLKHKEMAIGDQIGTIVFNSTLILGIVAIICPIKVRFLTFLVSASFMFIAAFIFVTFARTSKKLQRLEGVSLILLYVLFIVIQFFMRP